MTDPAIVIAAFAAVANLAQGFDLRARIVRLEDYIMPKQKEKHHAR